MISRILFVLTCCYPQTSFSLPTAPPANAVHTTYYYPAGDCTGGVLFNNTVPFGLCTGIGFGRLAPFVKYSACTEQMVQLQSCTDPECIFCMNFTYPVNVCHAVSPLIGSDVDVCAHVDESGK